jgi:hypothetical protein
MGTKATETEHRGTKGNISGDSLVSSIIFTLRRSSEGTFPGSIHSLHSSRKKSKLDTKPDEKGQRASIIIHKFVCLQQDLPLDTKIIGYSNACRNLHRENRKSNEIEREDPRLVCFDFSHSDRLRLVFG